MTLSDVNFGYEMAYCGPRIGVRLSDPNDDLVVEARIDGDAFENALDEISDDLSGWIADTVDRWLITAADLGELEETQRVMVNDILKKVRP